MKYFFLCFCLTISSLSFGQITWDGDYKKALEKSEQSDRPVLLFFTGSDWSGLAMKMKQEVFNSEEFQKKVGHDFVFIEVDFPHYKALSSEKNQQNDFLKEKYKIEEFPTILLLDQKQREIFRLTYIPENGSQLADDLIRIVAQDKELQEGLQHIEKSSKSLRKLYELAQDLQQPDALERLLSEGVKTDDPFFLLEKYRILVETKNLESASLKDKLITFQSPEIDFTVAMIEFQELANDPTKKKSPQETIRPLEAFLAKYQKSHLDKAWRIEMLIAQTYLEADDWKEALKHAAAASSMSPGEVKEEIASLITYIEKQQQIQEATN